MSDQPVSAVTDLLRHPDVWRAGRRLESQLPTIATGYPALDRVLAGQGWPARGSWSCFWINSVSVSYGC
ncbi:MAG: hypothetical protein HC809_17285 [Gammaproteobacteria bacterium]|nr:hypothetical protein [Gammaproteobacteria bacterium]